MCVLVLASTTHLPPVPPPPLFKSPGEGGGGEPSPKRLPLLCTLMRGAEQQTLDEGI